MLFPEAVSHFSTLFRAEAERLALSQAEISAATGIDGSLVSRLMSGKLPPSSDKLRAIVRFLDPENGVGQRLALAAVRDFVEEVGLPADTIQSAPRREQSSDEWWRGLVGPRSDRYRALEAGAVRDEDFDRLLDDLVPLALRLAGAHADAVRVVKFQAAEDPPKE